MAAITEPYLEQSIKRICKGGIRREDICQFLKGTKDYCCEIRRKIRNLWQEWNSGGEIYYYIVGLLVVVCIFFFLGFKKDVWFCDEVYSYTSANENGIKQNIFSYENEWIKGEAVTAYFSANDYKLNFQNIADSLYTDHVPLYFLLLRIVSIINMGSCSKWVGLGINLIFYCMLYIALWKFFERTGGLNSLTHLNIPLAVVTILVHSTTLSEALMIRMYLMFSLIPNSFLLVLDKKDMRSGRMILLSLAAMLGLLTHFYYWIWLALFSAAYLVYLAIAIPNLKSKLNVMGRYIGAMICALLCVTAIFPNWYTNII